MKSKYFITWNYSYDCYPTNRLEIYKVNGIEFKRAYFPITYSGTQKSIIELNNEMSILKNGHNSLKILKIKKQKLF